MISRDTYRSNDMFRLDGLTMLAHNFVRSKSLSCSSSCDSYLSLLYNFLRFSIFYCLLSFNRLMRSVFLVLAMLSRRFLFLSVREWQLWVVLLWCIEYIQGLNALCYYVYYTFLISWRSGWHLQGQPQPLHALLGYSEPSAIPSSFCHWLDFVQQHIFFFSDQILWYSLVTVFLGVDHIYLVLFYLLLTWISMLALCSDDFIS